MLKARESTVASKWEVVKKQGASYTGGRVAVSHDGATAACLCSERVALLDLRTGDVVRTLPPEVPVRAPRCGWQGLA